MLESHLLIAANSSRVKSEKSARVQGMQYKIMIVVGARPNFMKAAPLIAALHNYNDCRERTRFGCTAARLGYVLVHTGQHYDGRMSGRFFEDLGLPPPNVNLGVGSKSHATQTAEIMQKFEPVLSQEQPNAVIVVGDVNSTLACSLVAAKTVFKPSDTRPLIVHVEAGLRSFDRLMPEECNRVVTDHLADMLFATENSGVTNLVKEGISKDRIYFVGNTMVDSLVASKERARHSTILGQLGLQSASNGNGCRTVPAPYAVLTLHRPSNVDNRDVFVNILDGLKDLIAQCPVIFPCHPRTSARIREFALEHYFVTNGHGSNAQSTRGINLIQPLGYLDFLCLMMHARLVVTDSGGVQEETTCLRVPCVTVRENTERPVTFTCGTNVIAGTKKDSIRKAVERQMQSTAIACTPDKWDGKAAARIVDAIALELQKRSAAGHSGIKSPCDLATADGPRDERASNSVPKNSGPARERLEL